MKAKTDAELLYETVLRDVTRPMVGDKTTSTPLLLNAGKMLFGNKFLGVFASDRIPRMDTRYPYAIINLDPSTQPGSHWIGLAYVNKKRTLMYDSFGRSPREILPHRKLRSTQRDAEQSSKETDCGARVLAWLYVFDRAGEEAAMEI